jgi:hypothetical protein
LEVLFKIFCERKRQKRARCIGHAYNPSYAGARGRRIMVRGYLGKNKRPYLKNSYSKKGWRYGSRRRAIA